MLRKSKRNLDNIEANDNNLNLENIKADNFSRVLKQVGFQRHLKFYSTLFLEKKKTSFTIMYFNNLNGTYELV